MEVNLEPQFVDKIVNEVKAQGVFDEFRKDSIADVDTKPAYQNLRQRVENTVNKFLAEQKWTPELNKNQLRESLRKHITDAGYLDMGVERIVDQVVNPKIGSVFQPKIEDIAYNYLGIPKPEPEPDSDDSNISRFHGLLHIATDLMPTDLEQISPDSDRATVTSDTKEGFDIEDKLDDDDESPPFELLDENASYQERIETTFSADQIKLEDVVEGSEFQVSETLEVESTPLLECAENGNSTNQVKLEEESNTQISEDTQETQDSQFSQVSSDSHLSIVTDDNTQGEIRSRAKVKEDNEVNISEEAQMPRFNDNSNSDPEKKPTVPLHFDIKKDEIKFEGTERNRDEILSPPLMEDNSNDIKPDIQADNLLSNFENGNAFQMSKIEMKHEAEEISEPAPPSADSSDRELHIIERPEISQCSSSRHSIRSISPIRGKIPDSPSSPVPFRRKSSESPSPYRRNKLPTKMFLRNRQDSDTSSSTSYSPSSSSSSCSYKSMELSRSSSEHRVSSTTSYFQRRKYHNRSRSRHRHGRSPRSDRSFTNWYNRNRNRSRSDSSEKEKDSPKRKANDDHYSLKVKRRRSTHSNDDDSSQASPRATRDNGNGNQGNSTTRAGDSQSTVSRIHEEAKPSPKPEQTDKTGPEPNVQNIVILDSWLENPSTNFIDIGHARVQVISHEPDSSTIASQDNEALYYFENDSETKASVEHRLNILIKIIENIRKYSNVNALISDDDRKYISGTAIRPSRSKSTSPNKLKRRFDRSNSKRPPPFLLTNEALTIDCIQYKTDICSPRAGKRYKYGGNQNPELSPATSELSVNSKENEFIDKNTLHGSDSEPNHKVNMGKPKSNIYKNQRYTSEDLYKPRPVLGQRSRRRDLDRVI